MSAVELSDDDQQPTPRLTPAATILAGADTPAARLRALLSRVPTSSKSPAMPHPRSLPSEIESDFDPPTEIPSNTPSIARESLKDLFSRALREPGNTPQKDKTRWRRNSIDLSEVDATPRLQLENGRSIGKRRSLSDEEVDSPSKSRRSETSLKSSQAMTFDMLRERLMNSRSPLKDQRFPDSLYDHVDVGSNEIFLRNITSTSPPEATSTPQQSLRMSIDSSFPSQSNLLDQDSEMQRAIEGVGSYEDNTSHNGHMSPPSPKTLNSQKVSSFVQGHQHLQPSSSSRSKSTASDGAHGSALTTRGNGEFRPSSRMSLSEMSTSSYNDQDNMHDHEQGWNRRKPLSRSHTPELKQGSSHGIPLNNMSPTVTVKRTLSRRGSSASYNNFDGEPSKKSSIAFPAEHAEHSKATVKDHGTEQEWELNKRQAMHSRPTSSLDSHSPAGLDHPRTNSLSQQQTREDSFQSSTPPAHRLLRHHSFSNLTRASSPGGSSVGSHEAREELQEEDIVYERERNWNAPRQKWSLQGYESDSPSGARSSLSASFRLHDYPNGRNTEGLPKTRTKKGDKHQTATETSVTDNIDASSRRGAISPSPQPAILSRRASPTSTSSQRSTSRKQNEAHLRTRSSPSHGKEKNGSSSSIMLPSTFAASTSNLAPSLTFLELEKRGYMEPGSVRTVSPAHDARENARTLNHYMTTKLPGERHAVSPSLMDKDSEKPFKSSYMEESRSVKMSSRGTPSSAINHRREEETNANEYVNESLTEERTPKVRIIPPPPDEVSENTLGGPLSNPSPLLPPVHSILSTPPHRSPFNSKHRFQTPSPPNGLPELPEPPPFSSDGGEEEEMSFTQPSRHGTRLDFSAIRTPRPPGAWSSTSRQPHDGESAQSPLASTSKGDRENGLAAPVTSLSRVSSMPTRTPAPPGAWMATPAARRPLQKVRFDTQHSHTEHSLEEQDTDSSNPLQGPSYPSPQSNNASVPTEVPEGPPARTEESTSQLQELPTTPIFPRSRTSNPSRKSPSIRVVDAFGREQPPNDRSLDDLSKVHSRTRRKTGVRILDAMGRDIDGSEIPSGKLDETDPYIPPLNHVEALTRVRQGLCDLARGVDDMDMTDHDSQVDIRLHELNDASRAARETRERLYSAETDVRAKFEPLRASMKNGFPVSGAVDRRLHFTMNFRMWWGVLLLQLVIVFIMYRISMARARDLFLTTYYDPFYAELHLYTSRPDTLRRDMFSLSRTPWLSLSDTLRHQGWKASAGQLRDNIAVIVEDWQRQFWENWGSEGSQQLRGWPPT